MLGFFLLKKSLETHYGISQISLQFTSSVIPNIPRDDPCRQICTNKIYQVNVYRIDSICQSYQNVDYEPPRVYRRVIYLSQAAIPDRIKLS